MMANWRIENQISIKANLRVEGVLLLSTTVILRLVLRAMFFTDTNGWFRCYSFIPLSLASLHSRLNCRRTYKGYSAPEQKTAVYLIIQILGQFYCILKEMILDNRYARQRTTFP